MQCLNATVSPLLLGAIDGLVQEEGLSHEKIVRAITELSRRFNTERSSLNQTYLDDRLLSAAYLQYFLPVNLAKIQVLLTELPASETVEEFSVLDIGSGPGTGALAVLDWWYQRRWPCVVSVTTADKSRGALRQTRQLWDGYCRAAGLGEIDLQTVEGDLERRTWVEPVRKKAPFDLIILANALNEVHTGASDPIIARTALVEEALSLLAANGTMMIVEPALRETSRALHQVRDRLLQEKRCTIYSPCLHENNCPALVKPVDGCHEERAWAPPASIQEIDGEVGFIKDALKFSYLLLRKDGKTVVDRRPDVYRVVSELRHLKGEKRAWLCNETGRSEIGRQDRLVSPQNASVDAWHRVSIVQIERIAHKEKAGKVSTLGRIEQDAAVQIVRSV